MAPMYRQTACDLMKPGAHDYTWSLMRGVGMAFDDQSCRLGIIFDAIAFELFAPSFVVRTINLGDCYFQFIKHIGIY